MMNTVMWTYLVVHFVSEPRNDRFNMVLNIYIYIVINAEECTWMVLYNYPLDNYPRPITRDIQYWGTSLSNRRILRHWGNRLPKIILFLNVACERIRARMDFLLSSNELMWRYQHSNVTTTTTTSSLVLLILPLLLIDFVTNIIFIVLNVIPLVTVIMLPRSTSWPSSISSSLFPSSSTWLSSRPLSS